MTVKELIEYLQTLDEELLVVTPKGLEGKGFSLLLRFSFGQYTENTIWRGEFRDNPEDLNSPFPINAICLDSEN